MNTLVYIAILVIGGFLLSDSFVQIPAFHYGVREVFGKRRKGVVYEGLRLKIPFFEKIELVSMELKEIDITILFTTQDKLKLTCEGSLQYRPDEGILDKQEKNLFITMSEEIIKGGIDDSVKAKLGALGGVIEGAQFIEHRHAVSDMINCFFRLEQPPHRTHVQNDAEKCGLTNCEFDKEVNANELIKFYDAHWPLVKKLLDRENEFTTSRSQIEKRYGIDIDLFALADISFSEETQSSFEKEKQALARKGAFAQKKAMIGEMMALKASFQEAANAADISLDPKIEKKIVSVEGSVGVLGSFLTKS